MNHGLCSHLALPAILWCHLHMLESEVTNNMLCKKVIVERCPYIQILKKLESSLQIN